MKILSIVSSVVVVLMILLTSISFYRLYSDIFAHSTLKFVIYLFTTLQIFSVGLIILSVFLYKKKSFGWIFFIKRFGHGHISWPVCIYSRNILRGLLLDFLTRGADGDC